MIFHNRRRYAFIDEVDQIPSDVRVVPALHRKESPGDRRV